MPLTTSGIYLPKKIKDATALPEDVSNGKIFYNNDGRQVGQLIFDGNANVSDVKKGKTFYSNGTTKQIGTYENSFESLTGFNSFYIMHENFDIGHEFIPESYNTESLYSYEYFMPYYSEGNFIDYSNTLTVINMGLIKHNKICFSVKVNDLFISTYNSSSRYLDTAIILDKFLSSDREYINTVPFIIKILNSKKQIQFAIGRDSFNSRLLYPVSMSFLLAE